MDLNLCSRIVRSAGIVDDTTVMEVGAGPGNITRGKMSGKGEGGTHFKVHDKPS